MVNKRLGLLRMFDGDLLEGIFDLVGGERILNVLFGGLGSRLNVVSRFRAPERGISEVSFDLE